MVTSPIYYMLGSQYETSVLKMVCIIRCLMSGFTALSMPHFLTEHYCQQ